MPDPRSVMQEFRTLDAKRLARGLSPEEERRLRELRELVGDDAGGGAPRTGFDVNAAAARLRESLLPAGLRNRPPPPPELSPEPEPEPFFAAPVAPAPPAIDVEPPPAPEAPLFGEADASALFDPATLGWESEPAAGRAPYEPGAQDTGAPPWDPSALAADPNAQPWDPNTYATDPSAQPWDPNALAADPNAQPWDPNAYAADPSAQPWDPNAAADPNAQPWDPNAAAEAPATPDAAQWDPSPGVFDPAILGLDPSAAPAVEPDAPLELDSGAFELEPLDDDALVPEDGPSPDAPGADDASSPDVSALDAALPEGFGLDDAAAAPEPTEMLGLASEPEPTQALPLLAADPELPPPGWDPVPATEPAEPAAFGEYDELAAGGPALAAGEGPEAGLDPDLDLGFASAPAPLEAPAPIELGEYDDTAGFAPGAVFEPPPEGDFVPGPPLELGHAGLDAPPGEGGWLAEGEADPSFELASGGSFDAAPAPAGAPEPLPLEASEPEPSAAALPAVAASAEDDFGLPEIVEELPTIEGEEILEEIPADEADLQAPPPPPPPAAAAPAALPASADGVHRVVVHTLEGTVRRGVLEEAELSGPTLALAPAPGETAEPLATDKVKAIFFMLAPGEAPPAAEGRKVRVTFRDGRQVAGYSPDYREDGAGFFMIPEDTRTNTGRIWVYRAAVKQVTVS